MQLLPLRTDTRKGWSGSAEGYWKSDDKNKEAEDKQKRGTRWADDAVEVYDGDIPDGESDEREDDEDVGLVGLTLPTPQSRNNIAIFHAFFPFPIFCRSYLSLILLCFLDRITIFS